MKKLLLIITSLLLCFSLSSCSLLMFSVFNSYEQIEDEVQFSGSYPDETKVYIDYTESFFSDVFVTEQKTVSYVCELYICNDTEGDVTVNFLADFEEEYDMGYITSIYLAGEDENGNTSITLPAKNEEFYTITFKGELKGEYSGTPLKNDRNLPAIEMHLAETGV